MCPYVFFKAKYEFYSCTETAIIFLQQNTKFSIDSKRKCFLWLQNTKFFKLLANCCSLLDTRLKTVKICPNGHLFYDHEWPLEGAIKRPFVFCLRITDIELNLFFFQWTLNILKKKQTKLLAHLSQNDFLK